jgi:hypothetical protein
MKYVFTLGFGAAVIGAIFGNDPLSIAGIAVIFFAIVATA